MNTEHRTLNTEYRMSCRPAMIRHWMVDVGYSMFLFASLALRSFAADSGPTPEQIFEGGTNTYNNWVGLSFGAFLTKGSKAQAEQNHHMKDGVFGGIEDLHFQANAATNT